MVFTGFIVSISTDFSLYLKVVNGGSLTEDVTSIPEEHNEKSLEDSKLTPSFTIIQQLSLAEETSGSQYFQHHAELTEGACLEVPCPPPERA